MQETRELKQETLKTSDTDEVLVRVENVSKVFCRDLKGSLWYGLKDGVRELLPGSKGRHDGPGGLPVLRADEFWANQGISFELCRGDCLGLIGHNGAGKTTLLKMLNGLIKPDSGRITMRGRVGALIALGAGFNPILTGRENVYIAGSVYGLTKEEIDERYEQIVDFAELKDFMGTPVQNYSSGMQVRLGFAVALAMNPDILLLDEVLAVGDVAFQVKCFNALSRMRKNGIPFILVSHNMNNISRYCTKVIYLEHGKTKFYGDVSEGVNRFLQDMSGSSGVSGFGPDWTQVNGSGQIVLTHGEFRDEVGVKTKSISVGGKFYLVLSYQNKTANMGNLVLNFTIRNGAEQLFAFSSIRGPFRSVFSRCPDKGEIHIRLPGLLSAVDSLEFYVSLMDSQSKEIYDWKRGLKLDLVERSSIDCKNNKIVNIEIS